MSETYKKWIAAAKAFEDDPNAKVKCPECSIGELFIKDEIALEHRKLDRYLICNYCGKWNVISKPIFDDENDQ